MSLQDNVFHVSFETDEILDPELYDTAHFVIGSLLAVRKGVFAKATVVLHCLDGSTVAVEYPSDEPA